MSIEWHFDDMPENQINWKDIDKKLVSEIKSEMTYLEVLERENDQNFVDARFDTDNPTLSTYSELIIPSSEKEEFMKTLNMAEALKHVEAAVDPTNKEWPSSDQLDPIVGDEIKVLLLNHRNGLGLLGAERMQELAGGVPKNYLGLIKSTGLNDKQEGGGGGSHGVGKNVYWHWSQYGIVLFYSSLSMAYNDSGKYCSAPEGTNCNHSRRFIATCRVGVPHEIDGTFYSKSGLAGNNYHDGSKVMAVSLFDDEADSMAEKLGLEMRSNTDPGVTIAIVGWRNPGQEQEEGAEPILDRLLESAAANWFPASISGALEVSTIDQSGTEYEWEASLGGRTKLLKWLEKGEDEAPGPDWWVPNPEAATPTRIKVDTTYKRIELDLNIPKNYPGNLTNNVQKSKAVLALRITEKEWPTQYNHVESPSLGVETWGNIACIRHSGMVVTYKPFIQKPAKIYEGVLLVGKSVELFDKKLRGKINKNYQAIGEEMLKLSEPAVHDDWIPNTFQAAANSRDDSFKVIAKTGSDRIKQFLRAVEQAIRDELGDVEPPEASEDASWDELSKALDFGNSNSDSGGRIIRITKTSFDRVEPNKGKLSFDLEVPRLNDKRWTKGASKWTLKLKPSITFPDGTKVSRQKSFNCWDFSELLDEANHASMRPLVLMNYSTNKAKWKKKTSANAKLLKVDEWVGKKDHLEAPILSIKALKISFKDLEIDLTGYENASVELVIEANEVKP